MSAIRMAMALLSAAMLFAYPVRADDGADGRNIVLVKVLEIGLEKSSPGQDIVVLEETGPKKPYDAKFRVLKVFGGRLRKRHLSFSIPDEIHTTTLYLVVDATDQAHPALLSWDGVMQGYCPFRPQMHDYGLEAAMDAAQKDDPCTEAGRH